MSVTEFLHSCYGVLADYGIAEKSMSILNLLFIADKASDVRLSIACITLAKIAYKDDIGMDEKHYDDIINKVTQRVVDRLADG